MNRQGLIKLLQSNLSDEDVLEILEDIVCKNKNKYQHTDAYRPLYQPNCYFKEHDRDNLEPNFYTDH